MNGNRRTTVWTTGHESEPDTLAALRRWAETELSDLGKPHLTDAVLVAAELINNAHDHGGGLSEVRTTRIVRPCLVTIEVDDFNTNPPVLGRSRLPADDHRGRGVLIVDKLSEQWGITVDSASGSKTVWAQIGCKENPCR